MRKAILLMLVMVCFSCNRQETPEEVLFRNHLKETVKLYQNLCLSSACRLEQREIDEHRNRKGSGELRLIQAMFTEKFEKTKITDQSQLLKFQSKLYSKFNLLYPYQVRYECTERNKLIDLNIDILKLYIECDFYKTQYKNMEYQSGQWVVADGIHIINPVQLKKIQALDKEYAKAVKEILKHKTTN